MRSSTGYGTAAATCAFAVIASQVAGKATRDALFLSQNKSADPNTTSIPATFLRVTVTR